MTVSFRNYHHDEDYEKINEFFVRTYEKGGKYTNWLQPRWEYMIYHPNTEMELLKNFRIWEDDGKIVAFVNFEDGLGETFFHYDPNYAYLKKEMFDFAVQHLALVENNEATLVAHIPDFDEEMKEIAKTNGFEKDDEWLVYHTISRFDFNQLEDVKIPDGFQVKSLGEVNDINKFHQVMWRGFNHEGEAPAEGISWRERMQAAPNYRWDLNHVVINPEGDFVAFAGLFYDEKNHVGYIEPVATDPDYRRMGLGKAAIHEAIRKALALGIEDVFVESAIDFYLNIGFKKSFYRNKWVKKWQVK